MLVAKDKMSKAKNALTQDVAWLGPTSVKRDREWFILVRQADTMLCGFRLTNRWLSMKKDIASCESKYLAYSEVEVEYQGSSGLLLQLELPE
ncbi:hypothetical protein Tco_0727989 [Tanacetum coccineum]|uniref:Uncharacterized protein n=1 Tax=Tanacetum coccineum TaxID=301880 RepID=A0ABQ4YMY1_9ASTR